MTGTFMDWITQHYEGLVLLVWGIMTIVLIIEALVKISKDEDKKREAGKLTYREIDNEKDRTGFF